MTAVENEHASKSFYVVAVGASAGGLEALQRLFEKTPRTGGFAFVVTQHLSPDFKSLMDELLAPHTELAVKQAVDGMAVEPDCIYLLPPGNEMIISGGRLLLSERDPAKGLFLPIDVFFRSAAEDFGARAVGVVLSGTGSDGSRGVRAIHEAGGLVIAQTESSAKFDGMPRSAVDTGIVDLILPPEAIGEALSKYLEHDGRLAGGDGDKGEERDVMSRIFELLRQECGIDFADYKSSTVGRRIERRLLLSDTRDLDAYIERISHDPTELRSLYKDLLIGVTRFFRDPEAFERLRTEVLPQLIDKVPAGEEMRIWVAACATGEEAYTLAMLACEGFRARGRPALVRIFATDVHRHSLDVASAGVYSAEAVANVPAELRDRYFERHKDGWQVNSELRARIVFAHHNALRDAPFTRLDLLTCRNFLIYLGPSAQRKVLSLFHFALKTSGVLFLGPSESPGPLAEEFVPIDGRWKVFRKFRDIRLSPDLRLHPVAGEAGQRQAGPRHGGEDPRVARGRDLLIELYGPPFLLVDHAQRLLHSFNGAGEFLVQRDGRPSLQLLDLLDGELRFVVAAALKRAQKERARIEFGGVEVTTARGPRRVRVVVHPVELPTQPELCWGVALEPDTSPAEAARVLQLPDRADMDDLVKDRVVALEGELRLTKENLQATIEEMESSNEELQAANEELIASNEELQSTNEELHSVNEELYTVNAEYQAKIAELTQLTADMSNLLDATEVHTLFIDRELRLRKFTPKIAQTFNLLPQDVGRRLDSFAHNVDDPDLLADLERVGRSGESVEREVRDRQGRSYFLRILPYRVAGRLDGIVLTLIDISALKSAQRELLVSEERYRTLMRSITAILWTADADGRFVTPQAEWESYTGQGVDQHLGDGWLAALHADDRPAFEVAFRAAIVERRFFEAEGRLFARADNDYRHCVVRATPLLDERGFAREWVGHVVDAHDAKTHALELRKKEEQIGALLDHSPAFIFVKDAGGRYVLAGRRSEEVLGRPAAELLGKSDYDVLPLALADARRAGERRVLAEGDAERLEEQITTPSGERAFLTILFPLRDGKGALSAVGGISTDITERKRAEEESRQAVERRDRFLAMLSHELRTPLGAVLNATRLLGRKGFVDGVPDKIRRQILHMSRLIDDLLDVGRITRDQLTIERRALDLRSVVQDAAEIARPTAAAKGLDLKIDLPASPVAVRGDAVRLRQIVTNLLSNATTYTVDGHVDVGVRVEGGRAVVLVTDTGVGLAQQDLDRVFELFYQSPQPIHRPRGGLGVGLTLAQRLARMHGGDITVASDGPGKGSTFSLQLPMEEAHQIEVGATGVEREGARTLRIVIVEDNDDNRETLEELLRLEGHQVSSAKDGIAGAELILAERPDIAFVDVGLPGMDGFGVARKIRATSEGGIRLVALTGYGTHEDKAATADAGFDRHLVKPVDPDALLKLLGEYSGPRAS